MQQLANRPVLRSLLCLFVAASLVSCFRQVTTSPASESTIPAHPDAAAGVTTPDSAGSQPLVYSNIRPADYVGPEACGECHLKKYKSWREHPHSKMNQLASDRSVVGDFSGISVAYAGRRAVFRQVGSEYLVDYYDSADAGNLQRTFQVVRTVGSKYEQDYVAVQVTGPEPESDALYGEEIRLRFAWSIVAQRWLPQSYLEPTEYPGSEHLPDGQLRYDPFEPDREPFNERCARCHNTYPYDLRFYKILTEFGMLSGFPPFPGVTPRMVHEMAIEAEDEDLLRSVRLPMDRLVTTGISCESCHFGGRVHADHSKEYMVRFVPTHPDLEGWSPDHENARERPEVVNSICMQCHHSGESAQDNWPDGSAGVNSMESIELGQGACASEIKCTDCHNTHIAGPMAGAPDQEEHLEACIDCHREMGAPTLAQAHAQHDAADASCLDCHMPRIVQGFETYNRSHRISMPSENRILSTGMPNACNLCHLDKSLAWTRDQLQEKWGVRVPLPWSQRELYGTQFERPAGQAWLEHPHASVRTVTAGAYSRSTLGDAALPEVAAGLRDENAYVRMRHLQAIEAILGRTLGADEYDLTGPPETRETQVEALLDRFAAR